MLSESYWQLFPNGKQWDTNRVYGSPSHCVWQTLWKAHGQRSLEGYHPWGCTESDAWLRAPDVCRLQSEGGHSPEASVSLDGEDVKGSPVVLY